MTGLGQLLDADAVAEALGVGRDWVYAEVRAGRIPHVRLGRNVRFRAPVIEDWLRDLETRNNGPHKQAPPRCSNSRGHGTES